MIVTIYIYNIIFGNKSIENETQIRNNETRIHNNGIQIHNNLGSIAETKASEEVDYMISF